MTNWRDTIMTHTEMCDKLDELTKERDALALRLDVLMSAPPEAADELIAMQNGIIKTLESRLEAAANAFYAHWASDRGSTEECDAWTDLRVALGIETDHSGRLVEKGEPWKCGECGQEFGEQIDLALHMSAKHRV